MAAALLIAEGLSREFDTRMAVRDLSLSVEAGEIVTLLGPNGAGKTTTMRMLAGLILPGSGRITINQIEVSSSTADSARRAIGLLTEAPGLWERLTVRMNLVTYARLHGLPEPWKRVDEALEQVDLADRSHEVAGKLSKGLKQRVAIARALIHKPHVVLLDEPTSALDPSSARQVRNLILQLRKAGRAVLVSTHNLPEAEELSDRIAVLKTDLLAIDTPSALRRQLSGAQLVIEVEGDASQWLGKLPPSLSSRAEASGPRLTVPVEEIAAVPDVVSALVAAGARIVRVAPDRRSLEDVYLSLVGAA